MAHETRQLNTRIRLAQDVMPDGSGEGRRGMSLMAALGIVLFFLFWLSLLFLVPYRQFHLTPAWFFEHIQGRFSQLYGFLTGASLDFAITIYQYLAVMVVGAALAACGCVFKGVFRNELAGPSTMGVMAGGTLGLLIWLLVFVSPDGLPAFGQADLAAWAERPLLDVYGRQVFTLLGCCGSVALVLAVATAAGRGRLSASAMILSGTVLSALTGSVSRLLQYYMILSDPADPRIETLRDVSMGNFNSINGLGPLLLLAVPLLVCMAALLILRRRLNLLTLSEDEALTMGVNIRRYRYLVTALGTVMTAVVVAFCGHIGFLGYMLPLIGRRLAGPDMAKLLPVSLLLGAILLTVVYDMAYVVGLTDSLNLFTSAIGGVVLLITLLRKGGGARWS